MELFLEMLGVALFVIALILLWRPRRCRHNIVSFDTSIGPEKNREFH